MIKRLLMSLAVLMMPVQAHAWEQTMTCEYNCGDVTPLPTAWSTPCIGFYLNETGTEQMALADVEEITNQSIDEWNHPDISSLTTKLLGWTDEDRIGYNPYISSNANIIVFRDGDTWTESRSMMALTTVTHKNSTGEIFDADIEVNTTSYHYGIFERDGAKVVDLQNVLTHEVGHVFGLSHSDNITATMFPYSSSGEITLRTLEQDDLDAISTIYPPKDLKCDLKEGFFKKPKYAMDEGPAPDSSCSALPMSPSRIPSAIGLIWLGLFGLCLRRRLY